MLVIHEARLDDAGAYSCHVSNVIGSADSTATHVTVAEPGVDYSLHLHSTNLMFYHVTFTVGGRLRYNLIRFQ